MSLVSLFDHFAAQWREHHSHRRAASLMAALPSDLRRDLGWPAADLFIATRTRRLPR